MIIISSNQKKLGAKQQQPIFRTGEISFVKNELSNQETIRNFLNLSKKEQR